MPLYHSTLTTVHTGNRTCAICRKECDKSIQVDFFGDAIILFGICFPCVETMNAKVYAEKIEAMYADAVNAGYDIERLEPRLEVS